VTKGKVEKRRKRQKKYSKRPGKKLKPAYTPIKRYSKKKMEDGRGLWQLLKMKDDEALEDVERACLKVVAIKCSFGKALKI